MAPDARFSKTSVSLAAFATREAPMSSVPEVKKCTPEIPGSSTLGACRDTNRSAPYRSAQAPRAATDRGTSDSRVNETITPVPWA
jgi:hypothetical protein